MIYVERKHNCTTVTNNCCAHINGWYSTIPFWIFKKRVFLCMDCGDVLHGAKLKRAFEDRR